MTALEIRLAGYGAVALLLLLAVLGAFGYVGHMERQHKDDVAALGASQAQDKHDKGQADLSADVAPIVAAGQAKLDLTLHTQSENSNAIANSPGAAQVVDPALLRNTIAGLCKYEAYAADPGCAPVPAASAGVVQQAR